MSVELKNHGEIKDVVSFTTNNPLFTVIPMKATILPHKSLSIDIVYYPIDSSNVSCITSVKWKYSSQIPLNIKCEGKGGEYQLKINNKTLSFGKAVLGSNNLVYFEVYYNLYLDQIQVLQKQH